MGQIRSFGLVLMSAVLLLLAPGAASAETQPIEELTAAVVGVKTFINPDARTTQNLGREREGSGIVIDDNGLVLTIGYLMVEAYAAELATNDGRTVPADIVGYDHATGFGLLRANSPLKIRPLALGKSSALKQRDPALIASFGGAGKLAPVHVVSRREFVGNWEYLLEDAIFTAPPHLLWSGAALINREGKLVGVGSLAVGDAAGNGEGVAGNMFVPIDLLPPILADLIADGRAQGAARPWLGLNLLELSGRLVILRVTPGGPAEKAGVKRGEYIYGVAGDAATSLADFYRKVWATGSAGATIPLDVLQENGLRRFEVKSMDRMDHLKLKSTF